LKSKNISFEIIENSGPDNLRDTLKAKLAQATEVCIEVAFLTQAGLDEIIQPLRQVAAQGKVKLITGLYQHVTEPQALETLLTIQNETRGSFSVCLSTEPQFHRKVYLLESETEATAIIGSSNLTREGLQSGGELNAMLSLPKNAPSIRNLKNIFEQEWEHRSVPLEANQIKRYAQARRESDKSKSFNRTEIKKILGVKPTHHKATPTDSESAGFWRDCITGVVKKRTEQVISETTNWDRRKYFWYSAGGKHHYRIKDRIFLFDMNDNSLRLVEVTDIARTKIPTPDGRNFIAYKHIRGYSKRLTKNLWELLKAEGIKEKAIYNRVILSRKTAKQLSGLIKTKRA
jgi:HKD family nuclease